MEKPSSSSFDLSRWEKPPFPRRILAEQSDGEVLIEKTGDGWRIHNRLTRPLRNMLLGALLVAGLTGFAFVILRQLGATNSLSGVHWMWFWAGAAFVLASVITSVVFTYWVSKRRPDLLTFSGIDRRIRDSIDSSLVGARVDSLVCRVGRRTDPESTSGESIVQLAVVASRDDVRFVKPLWTFYRGMGASLQSRLLTGLAGSGVDVVEVAGEPQKVWHAEV